MVSISDTFQPPFTAPSTQPQPQTPAQCLATSGGCDFATAPANAAVLAPFVKLTIQASGTIITVGNRSAPNNGDHAVIKSFEYAYTERPICRVTIHDEQGSSFVKFMEDLLKNLKCSTDEIINKAIVEFGWVKTTCSGGVSKDPNKPQKHYMMINTVECNFDGGKLMYTLELTDLLDHHAEARVDPVKGEDGERGVYLVDAIREVLTDPEYPPSVSTVEFKRLTDDGKSTENIRFKDHDGDPYRGPKGKWKTNNLDKLNAVMEWLSQVVSENDKSLILTYDPVPENGKVIIWEDPKPNCDENVSLSSCIGKYIVNGGKDSRVLSFNPNFKFVFTNLASSGGAMGTMNVNSNPEQQSKNSGHDCDTLSRNYIKTGGVQLSHSATENNQNRFNKEADRKTMETQNKQLMAYFDAATTEPIEADLVIVGDPKLPNPLLTKFKPVHIVFINPYHLFPQSSGCGEWLAAPFCNEVLSNKAWRVKSVTHLIENGKYTTTIGIYLPAPGVHLNVGAPFGGAGSGGWTPPSYC